MPRIPIVLAASLLLVAPLMAQQIPQVQVPTAQTAAQGEAARRLGRQVTNDEIANAIRQSGLTTQQIRSRLQQAGLDPAMMDPFVGGSSGMPGAPGDTAPQGFFTALQSLGLAGSLGERLTPGTGLDAMTAALAQNPLISRTMDITLPTGHLAGAGAYEVFGKSLFVTQSSLFDPVTSGPVDPSYRIGAGDQLQIVLTGEVEAAYQVEVRRDGTFILPQVGQLSLAGLTVEGARGVFKQRATRVYSGIASGRTSVDMSIAQIRSITVFVAGEVEAPGGYQVSAVGSVFHALMRAGGPTVRGTFRNIEVRRGGKLLRTVDLYDYLANGNADSDLRVEQGDIIESLIGLVQRQNVRIMGQRADLLVETLVRARTLAGRPIPDALFDAAALERGALPLATFDRAQARYGVAIREP